MEPPRAAPWHPASAPVREGDSLWEPSSEQRSDSELGRYVAWLAHERGMVCDDYEALRRWSLQDLPAFWRSIVDYFQVPLQPREHSILSQPQMPGARWFSGAKLSYAERALAHDPNGLALIACCEDGSREELSYGELGHAVACVARGFTELGIGAGDRVVGYLPNGVPALVAFLASASLGAIWSSCPPEFGVESVLDRFRQIEPKLLVAVSGYQYGGKHFDRGQALQRIVAGLPSLAATVIAEADRYAPPELPGRVQRYESLLQGDARLECCAVDFEHPLWILYSSGTTGLPKALVQGHGGIVLEHLKMLGLHADIARGDRFFWFSTTGWMMWNYLVSGLLVGATVVLYDGSPGHPDLLALWRLAAREKVTHFGVSAAYLLACRKAEVEPGKDCDLSALRHVGSTGSPLPVEGFEWVYHSVKHDVLLGSMSGGTDLCTAFVASCPLLPVHAGEIQCRALGASVESWSELGEPLSDAVGELVITQPMPSMPLYLWGDPDGERYRASYFEMFPGTWRHGDWIRITPRGSCVIYGRSDSTLNRGGVRMGTSELYRVVEALPEVIDSLVVDSSELGKEGKLWLFVVLREGEALDDALRAKIARALREEISPRHVPDAMVQIASVPRTLSGKKLEVPIKRILAGVPLDKAVNPGTLQSADALYALLSSLGITPPATEK